MKLVGAFCYWAARAITWTLATVLWRIDIKGRENIPKTGAFLLSANHRSNVDGPLTCILTRRRMRYLAKEGMFKIETLGKLYKSMGAIPVNRGAPDRASLHACMEVLKGGRGLVLFPEGTRQTGDVITELHEGAAYLALRTGAPIVPVGFGNSVNAHKKGAWHLSFAKVTCIIGEPLYFERSDSARVTRVQISEATEKLRERLQELFDAAEARVGNGK